MSKARCWNCGSDRYYETAAVEACPSCGIRCDYHGEGANSLYQEAMNYQQALEAARELRRHRDMMKELEREYYCASDEE